MQLEELVQKLFLWAAVVVTPLAGGCKENRHHPSQYVAPGNSDWCVNWRDTCLYVAPGDAIVCGTWYEHGNSGGWYGPYNEWGFGWFYFKQDGSNIEGKYEHELYQQGYPCSELRRVSGVINGDALSLTTFTFDGSVSSTITAIVSGNIIDGVESGSTTAGSTYTAPINLERTNIVIERRATPW